MICRQYFEDKQTAKLTLPSWQLNSNSSTKVDNTTKSNSTSSELATDEKAPKKANPPPHNGFLEECDDKSVSSALTTSTSPSLSAANGIPVTVSVLTEDENPIVTSQCNGSTDTFDGEKTCETEKQSKAVSTVVSDRKRETRKANGKKGNSSESAEKHKKSDPKN